MNKKAKEIMNSTFESNQIRPGDVAYEWDKQHEFAPPIEETSWDEEDE